MLARIYTWIKKLPPCSGTLSVWGFAAAGTLRDRGLHPPSGWFGKFSPVPCISSAAFHPLHCDAMPVPGVRSLLLTLLLAGAAAARGVLLS
jgi:hypothetical protein